MAEEKRVHLRRSLQSEGWVAATDGDTWHAIAMKDISAGGLAFVANEQIPPDTTRVFRVQLPGNAHIISFTARIVHCLPHPYLGGFRFGAQFSDIDSDDLAVIEWFVSHKGG